MEQKNRQPQWDIYEAVILLDGYLKTVQRGLCESLLGRIIL